MCYLSGVILMPERNIYFVNMPLEFLCVLAENRGKKPIFSKTEIEKREKFRLNEREIARGVSMNKKINVQMHKFLWNAF